MRLTPEQIERERELFGRWFREHYDIPLIRNSRAEAAWLARAEGNYWTQHKEWQDADGCHMEPTHFMPLPAPPQQETAHE